MPFSHLIPCHPLLTHLQSFPASGSFPMSWFFASGSQSIGASFSVSVLPVNIQGWFPLRSTGLISLQSKRLSRIFSSTIVQKHQFFSAHRSLRSNSYNYLYMATSFDHIWPFWPYLTFVGKVMSLFLNTLSRFVIAFLPKSNCLLITWLQSPSPILEVKKIGSHMVPNFFPIYLPWSDGTRCYDISFLNAEF